MDKASFIQQVVVRFAHEPDKANDIIDRAERLADVLTARGYGFDPPPHPAGTGEDGGDIGWDGLPKATGKAPPAEGFHPAYRPYNPEPPPKTRAERLADLRHWRRLLAMNPGDAKIQAIVDGIESSLNARANDDPPLLTETRP